MRNSRKKEEMKVEEEWTDGGERGGEKVMQLIKRCYQRQMDKENM